MSKGCSYCGRSGHPAAECPKRLEDYFGTPGDPSAAMEDRVGGGEDDDE